MAREVLRPRPDGPILPALPRPPPRPQSATVARIHDFEVPEDAAGERLDAWLEARIDDCSRSRIAAAIRAGDCEVAPGRAKPGYHLRGGEHVRLELAPIAEPELEPEDIPLQILHEDAHLVVVDKPSGMVVHPAPGHARGTLAGALLGHYGISVAGEPWRPGLIHRLDADTSGVICVARTPEALAFYQDQFRARRVRKRYLALVAGEPRADLLTCEAPLGRHPRDFRKRAVVTADAAGARHARTDCVVRERHDGWCALEARPHTGRTHQVRVHLAHLGHPVLADAAYGRSFHHSAVPPAIPHLERQALHAWSIHLPALAGGEHHFRAPIPPDLALWVAADLEPLGD